MVVRTVPPRAGQLCAASTPELELTRCPGGVARGISCNVHGWTELRALTGEALIDDQTCTCSRWATALHPLVACLRTCRSMQFLGHLKTSVCKHLSANICRHLLRVLGLCFEAIYSFSDSSFVCTFHGPRPTTPPPPSNPGGRRHESVTKGCT